MRSKCIFLPERNQEIMKRYAQIAGSGNCKTQTEALSLVVASPCSRFWVAPERVAKVISKLHKGGTTEGMATCKRRMYEELYRRYLEKIQQEEFKNMSISLISEILVEEQAPEFYMETETAMDIFISERNKRRRKNRQ